MGSTPLWPLLAALFLTAACKDPAPSPTPDVSTPAREAGGLAHGVPQPLNDRLLQLGGEIDVRNRYLTALRLTTVWAGATKSRCGSVLLAPRVALTAGHCVCKPRMGSAPPDEGKTLIDTSACAEATTLGMVTYAPPKPGVVEDFGSRVDVFRGRVRPHPELRIVLGAQGEVLSSRANLALILLDEPLEETLHLMPLADSEVQTGESVVVVGYGYDPLTDGHDGDRRASMNKVLQTPKAHDDRLALEQPGNHVYKQDSGGPCLREGTQRPELVGISSRNLGSGATCTSIHPYREWLRAQLP